MSPLFLNSPVNCDSPSSPVSRRRRFLVPGVANGDAGGLIDHGSSLLWSLLNSEIKLFSVKDFQTLNMRIKEIF